LDVSRLLGCMVDGVVEGVLLDPGQRAHPVVDASGRWVFDEGDQYPGAHPTVSAEGEWVSDDRDPEAGGLDRVVVSAPGGVREPWEYRPPSSGSESYFGAPGDLWAGMVDWWFSHDIPTEGLPSGGGLMVGPLEMAKLGNFLKDALLPLMAGDIGLAGVGGLGPFDPVPVPFGKVIGEGVKGAKWVVKAVKAVGKGDDVVAGLAKSVPDTPAFYGIERLDETGWGNSEHDAVRGLFEESGESLRGNARMLSPDDPAIPDVVYHVTASGSDIAEEGVLRVGKDVGLGAGGGPPERLISFTVSREVAERLAADFELRRQVAVLGAKGDRAGVSELLRAESRRWGIEKSTPERVEELTGSSMWGAPEGQGMEYEWEYYLWEVHPEHGERELEDALGFFLTQRGRAGGPRNPLFMVGAGHIGRGEPEPLLSWATKTADDIQILAVPKENLAASGGAVVDFDLGKGFLEEIRVYGDVPVPAGGVARETGEAVGRHDTPFVAAARTNPKLNRLETSLQEVEERLNDALSPEMDGLRWSYISDNELIDEVADELANDPEYQRTLQQVLSDVFGGTEKDPIVLYRGRIPGSDSGREYVAASAHPRWAAAFGQGGFDLRGIAGLPDGELVELTVPRGNIAFHGSAEEAELIVSLDENVIERVIESLPRIPGR